MKTCVLFAAFAVSLLAQGPVSPTAGISPDTVVAKVGGEPVTAADIHSVLNTGNPSAIQAFQKDPKLFLTQTFGMMRYLAKEGEKRKLDQQTPLKETLELYRQNMIAAAMYNNERESYMVPTEAIDAFYAKNQSRFEQAKIKVITVAFCPEPVPAKNTSPEEMKRAAQDAIAAAHCEPKRSQDDAKKIAAGLVAKIRAGEDFAKIVASNSDDPISKASGGDFGSVTRGDSHPQEIKNVVFSLKQGEVSDPVRSGNSYYIIRADERSVLPLDKARTAIVDELKQQHFVEWLEQLNKSFAAEIVRPDFFSPAAQQPAKHDPSPSLKPSNQ